MHLFGGIFTLKLPSCLFFFHLSGRATSFNLLLAGNLNLDRYNVTQTIVFVGIACEKYSCEVPCFVSEMKEILKTLGLEHVWPNFKENRVCIFGILYSIDLWV